MNEHNNRAIDALIVAAMRGVDMDELAERFVSTNGMPDIESLPELTPEEKRALDEQCGPDYIKRLIAKRAASHWTRRHVR